MSCGQVQESPPTANSLLRVVAKGISGRVCYFLETLMLNALVAVRVGVELSLTETVKL